MARGRGSDRGLTYNLGNKMIMCNAKRGSEACHPEREERLSHTLVHEGRQLELHGGAPSGLAEGLAFKDSAHRGERRRRDELGSRLAQMTRPMSTPDRAQRPVQQDNSLQRQRNQVAQAFSACFLCSFPSLPKQHSRVQHKRLCLLTLCAYAPGCGKSRPAGLAPGSAKTP